MRGIMVMKQVGSTEHGNETQLYILLMPALRLQAGRYGQFKKMWVCQYKTVDLLKRLF
jgi:hypothetical protein